MAAILLGAVQPVSCLAAIDTAVTIRNRGAYHFVTMDLTKNVPRKEVGKQYARAILEAVPGYETLADSYLAEIIQGAELDLDTCLSRMEQIKGTIPEEYADELNGMAQVFSYGTDKLGDGHLSPNELWLLNLVPDVVRPTACSAVSVFGSASATGTNILGRSLDWFLGSKGQAEDFHMVSVIKNKDRSVCLIGFLGINFCVTGFNDDHVFAAILDCEIDAPYTAQGKRSYTFDLRHALENKRTLKEVADYMRDKPYAFNHLIFLADSSESQVLENEISQSERKLRSWDSALRPPTTWGITDAAATVNSFLLPGNFDNQTPWPSNTARWASFKTQVSARLPILSFEDIREVISFYTGSIPGKSAAGDIYHDNGDFQTVESIVFEPGSYHLEIAFAPTGPLPPHPDFKTIFDGLSDPFATDNGAGTSSVTTGTGAGTKTEVTWRIVD